MMRVISKEICQPGRKAKASKLKTSLLRRNTHSDTGAFHFQVA